MRIHIKAKPRARERKVEQIDETHFVVSVKEHPIEGKANYAVLEAIADYFDVTLAQVKIISGLSSKEKIIEINK